MIDVCVIAEGGWPARTGGLATWTDAVVAALPDAEVAVMILDEHRSDAGEFPIRPQIVEIARPAGRLPRVPRARRYLASGLRSAELGLAVGDHVARRLMYVEHGDAVAELLRGGMVSEQGSRVSTRDRERMATSVAERRTRVVRAVTCAIGVTRRSVARARAEGARRVAWIPNAVMPLTDVRVPDSTDGRRIGFVGRLSLDKGIDRFAALIRQMKRQSPADVTGVATGLPSLASPLLLDMTGVELRIAPVDPWDARLSAVALPSRLDACPFVALEAEARGIPTLVSDAGELPTSPLIAVLPWSLDGWSNAVDGLLAQPVDPAMGRRIAAARWRRFVTAWRRQTGAIV